MAKRQKERFPYWKTVYSLKQFLLEKKRRIDSGIATGTILRENVAENYLIKISDILNSKYFEDLNLSLKIGKLMTLLIEEDCVLNQEIERLRGDIRREEELLATFSESKAHRDFAIPDEAELYLIATRQNMQAKLKKIREELRVYEYRLRVCRDLKGIISRPNHYFDAVWK